MRRILLWTAILGAAVVLVIFGIWTALWISVGGTFFRGEQVTLGIIFQIGLAILSCVGLAFLIRSMFRAASKA